MIFGLYDQATTIDTTLRLDRELNEVQLQIDQIQGQLRYLDAQTSISTLKVAMSENEPDVEALSEEDEAPSLGDAWDSATDGFLGVLSAMIVGLGYLIPIAIVAGSCTRWSCWCGVAVAQPAERARPLGADRREGGVFARPGPRSRRTTRRPPATRRRAPPRLAASSARGTDETLP